MGSERKSMRISLDDMQLLTNTILVWVFLICIACNTQAPDQTEPQKTEAIPKLNTDSLLHQAIALQNDSNILGDKIFLANQADENGLRSPDTILIIGTFADSLKAVQAQEEMRIPTQIISTSRYHYPGKENAFLLFSQDLSDSINYANANPIQIFKIRPNNFSDDKSLTPNELDLAYSNYDIMLLDTSRNVYLIRPKKIYEHARMFTRLIQFDTKGRQQHAVTLSDFDLTAVAYTDFGYVIALNDFGHGASRLFRGEPYAWKVVALNQSLKPIGEFRVSQPHAQIIDVRYSHPQYIASLEIHTGCDMCSDAFCYVDVALNTGFDPVEVKITQQPKDYNLDADTLLKLIRSQ